MLSAIPLTKHMPLCSRVSIAPNPLVFRILILAMLPDIATLRLSPELSRNGIHVRPRRSEEHGLSRSTEFTEAPYTKQQILLSSDGALVTVVISEVFRLASCHEFDMLAS